MAGQRIVFTTRVSFSTGGKSAGGEILSGLSFSDVSFPQTIKIESLNISSFVSASDTQKAYDYIYVQHAVTIGTCDLEFSTSDLTASINGIGDEPDTRDAATKMSMHRNIESIEDISLSTKLENVLLSGLLTPSKPYVYKRTRPDRAIIINFQEPKNEYGLFFHFRTLNIGYPSYMMISGVIEK